MARKQSNIYYRKDGRWEGRLHISGTKKYRSVYGKSYAEAKEKLERLRMENTKPVKKCGMTFCEVILLWLEEKKLTVKESSAEVYRLKFHKHIESFFRNIKYESITPEIVSRFVHVKLESGFSSGYVADILSVLKCAVKWAVRVYGYADRISSVMLPKAKKKEPILLNCEQKAILQNVLLNHTDDNICLGILLAMFTGLRIDEVCGIKWGDIDFDKKILYIRRTVQRINVSNGKSKTAVRITLPKTDTSAREIPLPPFLKKYLAIAKDGDEKYILSGCEKPVEPRLLTHHFKKILKNAELPSVKFHSLRHSFASFCLQKSFDIKTLSEILGHSSPDITMKIYVHTSMERKAECMNRLALF